MEVTIHTIFSDVLDRTAGRDSLVGKIAEWIGSAIIEGRLHPGDDLNSVALSHRFQTSRTPVREALMLLEKEGLVTIPPRRRPYVAHVSLREVREIYEVRAHLYTLVSELIVAHAQGEAIQVLWEQQAQLEAAERAGDRDAYFWRNLSFRATEVESCGNTQLRRTLDSLGLRTLQARHQSLTHPGRMERSVQDHARLVRAYEDRDAPLATALTRSLVLGGLAAIEATGWAMADTSIGDTSIGDTSIGDTSIGDTSDGIGVADIVENAEDADAEDADGADDAVSLPPPMPDGRVH